MHTTVWSNINKISQCFLINHFIRFPRVVCITMSICRLVTNSSSKSLKSNVFGHRRMDTCDVCVSVCRFHENCSICDNMEYLWIIDHIGSWNILDVMMTRQTFVFYVKIIYVCAIVYRKKETTNEYRCI